MLKLSRQKIARECTNHSVFMRGLRYYRRGAVKELICNEALDHIEAQVLGTKRYFVEIFESHQSINYFCTCAAFANYDGFCKHITAVLLALSEQDPEDNFKAAEEALVNDLLDTYSGRVAGNGSRNEVALDVHIRIRNSYYYNSPPLYYVSLKIGEARKYVVRRIDKLIAAITQRKPFISESSLPMIRRSLFFSNSRGVLEFLSGSMGSEEQAGRYQPEILKGKEIQLSAVFSGGC